MPHRSRAEAGKLLAELSEEQQSALELLSKKYTAEDVQARLGISAHALEQVLQGAKIAMGANDDPVDEYLELLDQWKGPSGKSILQETVAGYSEPKPIPASGRQEMLDKIARDFDPAQMRELSASLLRLADCIDQDWNPSNVKSSYRWPTKAWKIERDAYNLALKATALMKRGRERGEMLSEEFFGEPAWEMLLELFIQFAGGAKVSTTSLAIAANTPTTTAIRYLEKLEADGLIKRSVPCTDKRVTFVELTRDGVVKVGTLIDRLSREP